jgi:hypothetical protein
MERCPIYAMMGDKDEKDLPLHTQVWTEMANKVGSNVELNSQTKNLTVIT